MTKRNQCSHDTVWMGLCTDCGEAAEEEEDYIKAGFVSLDAGFRVKRACAVQMEAETLQTLTDAKKCVLVLDLDHTLVHVTDREPTDLPKPPKFLTEMFMQGQAATESEVYQFSDGRSVFHMKLRPGLCDFLQHAKSRFQLYIYTHGTLEYASVVLQALDPKGEIFGCPPRLIARDGNSRSIEQKSLKKIFPTEHKLVLILDDRSDVWLEAEDNLIQITPYLYFNDQDRTRIGVEACCPPVHALGWEGDSLDRQLSLIQPVLDNLVAMTYFSEEESPDVRTHLRGLREGVLRGLKIATSGMIPMAEPDPLSHPVSGLLRNLGAILALDDDVDFLICANSETRRAREMSQRGVPILHPWFLLHAQATLSRPPFDLFMLNAVDQKSKSHWELVQAENDNVGSEEAADLLADLFS